MTKKDLYTVTEAAEFLGITETQVRRYCVSGTCGRKIGRDWVITGAELAALVDRPGPGRPRSMVAVDVAWSAEYGEITRYVIGHDDAGRWCTIWSGWRWPTEDGEAPAADVDDGENGIAWYRTQSDAVAAMADIIDAMSVSDPDWAEETMESLGDLGG